MSSVYDLNTHIKEHMEKMPKTLNTKKEIDEYFKFGIKEIIMKEKKLEMIFFKWHPLPPTVTCKSAA